MTKIDIISGFLGAGKTTLIKKLLSDAYKGEQVVLIENEFGEIGIDGGFLKEAGIEIREMNSGCICCSLVGDFGKSLHEVVDTYHPDRILIEPSGVGKLSDVIKAVQDVQGEIDAELNSFTTVVDVTKCKIYRKNFGEFFSNQIEYAGAVILSRTDKAKPEKIQESVALLRELNEKAPIITTPIEQLPGEKILETMESSKSLEDELLAEVAKEAHDHEHHHHDHEDHHDHGHHHHHEHGEYQDAHARAHANDIKRRFDGREVTNWQILLFGLTGGLIPCPAAITVLLICIQLKALTLGATLVVSFSIGLALTLVTVGVGAAISVQQVAKRWSGFNTLAKRAPYFSSLLIGLVGVYMGVHGFMGIMR